MLFLSVLPLLAFCVGRVFSQSSITLWEFGAGRLIAGSTTLPLQPIGTAGLATTYIYELADSVETELSGGTTELVTLNPISRTIVASASGWFEPFSVNTIQCHFLDSTFGECFDTSATASGAPTPHGIALASPTPVTTSSLSTGISESTFTSSPSASSAPTSIVSPTTTSVSDVSQSSRTSSVGAIVGGSIAGLAALLALGVIFWLFRRKRAQKVADPEKFILGQPKPGLLQTELDPLSPNSGSHDNVKGLQLQRKQLEELIQSLQMASATAARENDSQEEDSILKARLANISERLMRLEEQGWVNEPLPDYS